MIIATSRHFDLRAAQEPKQLKPETSTGRDVLDKTFYTFKLLFKREVFNVLLIIAGIFSAGFGLKSFLLPNNFIDGGVTGMSLLTSQVSGVKLPLLIVILNIPFIILGFTQMGRKFALKTVMAIIGLALCVATINYPVLTADKLLVSVFGGFFMGAGIGLAMRGGAVIDGTEAMAIYLSKKTGVAVGDVILLLNIVIFSFAAWLLSLEIALYSILAYLSASKTVDFFIEGIEEYISVSIVSEKSEEIREMITAGMGQAVTIYRGAKGFGLSRDEFNEIDILHSVVTRFEVTRLKKEVERIDPDAFMVMNRVKDIKGGMIRKRPLH
ncbi:MAG: YitT family protein [Bacteroidia bacterium]